MLPQAKPVDLTQPSPVLGGEGASRPCRWPYCSRAESTTADCRCPTHIGNGWFGGFLPATVFVIAAATGNIYSGLWYPVGIAVMSLIIE
jgi:hypothetical protein